MARQKQIDGEKQVVRVGLRMVPYYGIEFDHPALRGTTAVGRDPAKALANARGALRHHFPFAKYEVEVYPLNPGPFERAGLEVTM